MHAPRRKHPSEAHKHSALESLSIAGIAARMSPVGLHFYAEGFLRAAVSTDGDPTAFEPARYYLVCHAIELCLKAFLSLRGNLMIDMAKDPGHDLERLLARAKAGGLSEVVTLGNHHEVAIHMATNYYREKVFEYPALGEAIRAYPGLPYYDDLTSAAFELVTKLRDPCINAE